ncbi:hypothetical protein GYA93_22095 [Gordonia desulfuricans]|uniref:Uncharacterized protein n=1 Tax=Gordonia desulfuricans TaxID=89051 RepID=A0A7K3LVA7_9ACTN|nr:hypothetical protein [Gordonia desulfuricans]NDK92228.1 hypothetical protein [Gordonia desulfuricans]
MCGTPVPPPQWCGAGIVDDAGARRRARAASVRVLAAMLAGSAVRVTADLAGIGYTVSSADGRSRVVSDLAAVWPTLAELPGRPFDPLDPGMLARLRELGTADR